MGAWCVTLICEGYALITVGFALWPLDSSVPASLGRVRFELIQIVSMAVIVLAGTAFYAVGRRQVKQDSLAES